MIEGFHGETTCVWNKSFVVNSAHIVGQPFITVEHLNTITYTTVCLKGERVPRAFLTTQIELHLTL